MVPSPRLAPEEIERRLAQLPKWALQEGKLHRELRFPSFVAAFGFMTRVALVAEKRDHHPDWSNSYDRVVIDLSSHDVGGVSARDFELARSIDEIAG
jgi:4a-hydroxytetrahydrobiopterin dehydratase